MGAPARVATIPLTGYTVRCLELPGAISEGEIREEALANIKEAIVLVPEVLSEELKARSNVEVLKVELADVC